MPRQRIRPPRLDDQLAVVTGASSGIGHQIAVDLARHGATVVGVARRAELLAEVQYELRRHSPHSWTTVCDVTNEAELVRTLAAIDARAPIDILINNAGIDQITPIGSTDIGLVRRLLDVNFFAPVTATLWMLQRANRSRPCVIVNVSSDAARVAEPFQGAYSASKAALTAFTESASYELANSSVQVHLLYPGWVETPMNETLHAAGVPLPPKAVRRTAEEVSALLLKRLDSKRVDINATRIPLLAPIARVLSPKAFQRSMERLAARHSFSLPEPLTGDRVSAQDSGDRS